MKIRLKKLMLFCKAHKVLSVFLALLMVVVIHGLAWISCVQLMYAPHMEGYERTTMFSFTRYTDDYVYLVAAPGYPEFTGNLCVAYAEGGSDLLIWPKAFRDDIYWLTIKTEDGKTYSIYTDSKCKPFSGNPMETKAIEENKEIVENLFKEANKEWDLKD